MKPSERQVGGSHYKDFAIQPSQFIHRNGIGWHEGNAIKRISRWKQKGGHEDLLKAIHEIELLLEEEGYYDGRDDSKQSKHQVDFSWDGFREWELEV